jgi:predicted nucleic acid-binding protein
MIILDTNVVSELMRLEPHPSLERWMSAKHPDDLYLSTITIAEMLTGVMEMAAGRRRDTTEARVRRIIDNFGPTYPPFGAEAAEIYASFAAGNPEMDTFDGQIAAIVRAHGAKLATRNLKHFRSFGVDLIDPWSA